jgi:ferredoxin
VTFSVVIDPGRCQGHGKCMLDCPEVFDCDENGYAVVTVAALGEELRAAVDRAVRGCPERAISITGS